MVQPPQPVARRRPRPSDSSRTAARARRSRSRAGRAVRRHRRSAGCARSRADDRPACPDPRGVRSDAGERGLVVGARTDRGVGGATTGSSGTTRLRRRVGRGPVGPHARRVAGRGRRARHRARAGAARVAASSSSTPTTRPIASRGAPTWDAVTMLRERCRRDGSAAVVHVECAVADAARRRTLSHVGRRSPADGRG